MKFKIIFFLLPWRFRSPTDSNAVATDTRPLKMIFFKTTFSIKILNLLIALYPIAFALGNLSINLITILIIIFGIYFFRLDIFKIEKNLFNYSIIIFFIFLTMTTIANYYTKIEQNQIYLDNIFKSLFFFKCLLLFLIVFFILLCFSL